MEKKMWFGPQRDMRWVPEFILTDSTWQREGWADTATSMNGYGSVRRATGSHRTFNLSFGVTPIEELQFINDCFNGTRGNGPFYFIDPFSTLNILPPHWADPSMVGVSAPALFSKRPLVYDTPDNDFDFPLESVSYILDDLSGNTVSRKTFIPLAPDSSVSLSIIGSAYNVQAVAQMIGKNGMVMSETIVPINDLTTFAPSRIFGAPEYSGFKLFFRRVSGATFSFLNLTAIQAYSYPSLLNQDQALPFVRDGILYTLGTIAGGIGYIEATVSNGIGLVTLAPVGSFVVQFPEKFSGGRGHTGAEFIQPPLDAPVFGRPGMVTMNVVMKEVNRD